MIAEDVGGTYVRHLHASARLDNAEGFDSLHFSSNAA